MTLKVASFHGSLEPKLLEIWKNYWHVSDTKIIQTTQKSSYFAFVKLYKGKNPSYFHNYMRYTFKIISKIPDFASRIFVEETWEFKIPDL